MMDAAADVRRLEEENARLRMALELISMWDQELQDRIVATGNGVAMWRACVVIAREALCMGEPEKGV